VDVDRLEALGMSPMAPVLAQIDAIRTPRALAAEAGHLAAIGSAGPFGTSLVIDPARPRAPTVRLTPGGIMLPAPEYYDGTDPALVDARARYERYLSTIFALVGRPDPAAEARAVVSLETAMARAHPRDGEATRESVRRLTLDELSRDMPGFDWKAWARPQNLDRAPAVVVASPSFFATFADLARTTPLEAWKAWLRARYITATAPYLSRPFEDARFEFFGQALSGQELPRDRWRRGVALVSLSLGDAIGRLYVDRHFPDSSKRRVEGIVGRLVDAYREAFENRTWMSADARQEARRKLDRLDEKLGFPAQWRSYRGLEIRADDLVGNIERAKRFETTSRLRSAAATGSVGGWLMTPQTVNAYYGPTLNEIVFPAAILQPPYFNAAADDAVNYGAIGAVIGHEISHAFFGQGRSIDADGATRDWWGQSDVETFARGIAARLVSQFDAYSPQPSLHVDGTRTLGENIGDLAGLTVAYRAYEASQGGRTPPVIDGFTGDQRFFLGWAQIWRTKVREEYVRQLLAMTSHAPGQYRANGPVGHLDSFHRAFAVTAGDAMYVAPADRVRIW
jgi:predicted metalloendopeptidase